MKVHKATQEFYYCHSIGEHRRCSIGNDGICEMCVPSNKDDYIAQQRARLADEVANAQAIFEHSVEGLL